MYELKHGIEGRDKEGGEHDKQGVVAEIRQLIDQAGYEIVEEDRNKPWGAYFRLSGEQADTFVEEFFPGLSPVEARLGNPSAELSPKILVVSPEQRLSWQVHGRRAERWRFLTDGKYHKSLDPAVMGEPVEAKAGDVVQFEAGECHRLVGDVYNTTLVAEIWQHTDSKKPSDEDDIVRIEDDYQR